MVVNVPGVKPGAAELVLDGPTKSPRSIWARSVKPWNDPAIAKLNPNLKLPDLAIANIHRADGSGTTFNFTYPPPGGVRSPDEHARRGREPGAGARCARHRRPRDHDRRGRARWWRCRKATATSGSCSPAGPTPRRSRPRCARRTPVAHHDRAAGRAREARRRLTGGGARQAGRPPAADPVAGRGVRLGPLRGVGLVIDAALDVEMREDAVEGAGQCPVGFSCDEHQAGHEDHADDQRVEQHRAGEAEAEQFDDSFTAEDEGAEDEHHDDRRGGDRAIGCGEATRDGEAGCRRVQCHSS